MSDMKQAKGGPAWPALLRSQAGMTMIELLTVLVIIGVLAAIAVPAYFQHRDRATDATAQASARAAQTAALEIGQENGGDYAGARGVNVTNILALEPTLRDVQLSVPMARSDAFSVRVQAATGNNFTITQNNDGTVNLTCSSADSAGCPADGTWD